MNDYARQRLDASCAAQGIAVKPGPEVIEAVAAILASADRRVTHDKAA